MHSDLEVDEYHATCPKAILDTLLSSIPNLKGFPNMLGLSSSQQYFSEMNLSQIMGSTTGIPRISIDSPTRTYPPPI